MAASAIELIHVRAVAKDTFMHKSKGCHHVFAAAACSAVCFMNAMNLKSKVRLD